MQDIVNKITLVLSDPTPFVNASRQKLDVYNENAISVWASFINELI